MSKRRLENYRIVGELGRGGMSTVHRAIQISLNRTVAIKEIHPRFTTSPELIARFEREAHAIAQVSHPCIVQIFDYIHQNDSHYIVMEFIEGNDLKSIIERCGRLSPPQVVAIGVRVSAALAFAHAAGIIHRDIKPSNILLTREGQVKVVDFGVARMEEDKEITRTGAFVGTPAYMSPEQVLGERLDGRTDVFSLGVVLYEAMTGEKPFREDERTSAVSRILKTPPPPLRRRARTVSRQIERIVMRCLVKERDRRIRSMSELNVALRAALPRRERVRPRLLISLANKLEEASAPGDGGRRLDTGSGSDRHGPFPLPKSLGFAAALAVAVGLGFLFWSNPLTGDSAEGASPAGPAPDTSVAAANRLANPSAAVVPGFLKVVVRPWADVRVDGELYDTTPFAEPIRLSPGSHTIELVHESLPPRLFKIVAQAGETKVLNVDLRH